MEQSLFKSIKSAVANWWVSLILGILYIVLGIWLIFAPEDGYVAISIAFSVMLFMSGLLEIFFAATNRKILDGWGWYLAGGILDFVLGFILVCAPTITMAIIPFILAFWLMFRGIMGIGTSFDLQAYKVKGWGWMLTAGILTVVMSFMVIANPLAGAIAIIYFMSLAFVFVGIYRIVLSMQLRKLHKVGENIEESLN